MLRRCVIYRNVGEAKMADRVIDYDRGVLINVHKETGMDVFMYVDEPGKYLTAHGHPVPAAIAAQAGYDTEKLEKERIRQERKLQASAIIDKELSDEKDVVEIEVGKAAGFTLVSIGLGRHHLKDPEGNQITANPLTLEQGKKLLAAMSEDVTKGKVAAPGGSQKNA